MLHKYFFEKLFKSYKTIRIETYKRVIEILVDTEGQHIFEMKTIYIEEYHTYQREGNSLAAYRERIIMQQQYIQISIKK